MFNALKADTYVGGGDISATRIIAPPRIVALRKFHEDEIQEDAADRIWSLLGSSTHRILELSTGETEGLKIEHRLGMDIEGWRVTGQPDVWHDGAIYDYKVTSVWSVLFGEKPEWERQLNIQAMLHRHGGDKVSSVSIVAILRDWQARKARFEKDYPGQAVKVIGLPLWSQDEAIEYVTKRVKLHQKTQADYIKSGKNPDTLPMCTEDERWYRGAGWAVKKMDSKGKINKKADRVFTSLTDARQYQSDNASQLPKGKSWAPLEERKGENIRCLQYCDVWFKCPFGKALHAALVNETPAGEEEEAA